MRTLQPSNRVRIGLMTAALVAMSTGVGVGFGSIPLLFGRPAYYGEFADTGQLNVGDEVRIVGVRVGKVDGIKIDGDHIQVKFSIGSDTIGTESRLAIKTDTLLGKKLVEIEPRGTRILRPGGALPLSQTTTPYQIFDAFNDITNAATEWNVDSVKESLKLLSETVDKTSPHLSAALDGVTKFADTVGKRDGQIKHLLAQANQVAGVLGDRSQQINSLLVNAESLLAAFNERRYEIDTLLGHVSRFSTQVRGFIDENPGMHHLLETVRTVSDQLNKHRDDIDVFLDAAKNYVTGLSESAASGPYLKANIQNLLPFWVTQPWVDAAFKKRGIVPEEFWRNAGLPEFRYPDPNGTRFPNGAPPPAPRVLEGTPEHPGPAVVPGTPCSYAPGAGNFPTPANPLPCAGLDANQGPFGPHGGLGPYPGGLPDVLTSPPNPDGLVSSPGIPMGGRPGTPGPDLPGTPVPLPPDAPPGARGEPLGPVSGPQEGNPNSPNWGTPGDKTLPPPTGPLGRGPGDQVPTPFIPPGQGGNSQPGGGGGSIGR